MEGHLLLEHPLDFQCDWLCLCHYCSAERPQSWISCGRRVGAHEDAMSLGDNHTVTSSKSFLKVREKGALCCPRFFLPGQCLLLRDTFHPHQSHTTEWVLFPSVAPLSWIVVQQQQSSSEALCWRRLSFSLLSAYPPAPALFCYLGELKAGQSLVSRILEHRMGHTICGSLASADVLSYL